MRKLTFVAGGTLAAVAAVAGTTWREAPEGVPGAVNGTEPKIRAEYPVDAETPPAFLAQAKDDFCQIETTVFYARALEAAGVRNCRTVLMDHGGHGYGLRKVGNPTDAWSDRAAAWLDQILRTGNLTSK